jgi:hypothetical protein
MIGVVSTSAEIVAWICFVVGIVLLLAGVAIGLVLSLREWHQKMTRLRGQVDDLKETAVRGSRSATVDEKAASSVEAQAAAVKSSLDEIGGIVASLPQNIRFAGLLVLVGAALMSVATVQFGGHSIF